MFDSPLKRHSHGLAKILNINPTREADMKNGDIRFVAYWYERDAIDSDDDFNPYRISSGCFTTCADAVSAGKRGAFKASVAEWCQVVEEVCTNHKYDHWDDIKTTTFSRNNNRWSVEDIQQAS